MDTPYKSTQDFNGFQKALNKITRKASLRFKEINYTQIAKNWPIIFENSEIAVRIIPQKFIHNKKQNTAILVIAVPEYEKLEWLHRTDDIMQKINTYFGQNVVLRVKVTSINKTL